MFVPTSTILYSVESVLLSVGQDPSASAYAAQYIRMVIPGLFMQTLFTSTSIYLSAMERMFIPMAIQCAVVPLHYLLCQLFVINLDFQIVGCAFAQNITITTAFVLINIYVKYSNDDILKESWVSFSVKSLEEFKSYVWTALTSLLLLALDYWCYYIITSFGGWLGVKEYAAVSFLNILGLPITFYHVSFSYAISALVGQYLGANKCRKAKKVFKVAILTCLSSLLVINTTLFIYMENIVMNYTQDPELIQLATMALRGYLVCSLIETYMSNLSGCIRGLGKQEDASRLMTNCILFVSMPMGYILPFYFNFGILGLLGGYISGIFLTAVLFSRLVFTYDWQSISDDIRGDLNDNDL